MVGCLQQSTINLDTSNIKNLVSNSTATDYCGTGYAYGYIYNSQAQISALTVIFSSLQAKSNTIVSRAGLSAFAYETQISMSSVTLKNNNISVYGLYADALCGFISGQFNSSCFVQLYKIVLQNLISNVNSISGTSYVSSGIGIVAISVFIDIQQISISNIQLSSQSQTGSVLGASLISLQSQSKILVNRVQTNSISISVTGYTNCYLGGISKVIQSEIQIDYYLSFDMQLYINTQTGNLSLGGAVGNINNSNTILSNSKIIQLYINGQNRNWNMVGGYIGSIMGSNLTQTHSIIFNSSIQSSSSNKEVNIGGFMGISELYSNLTFVDCTVSSILLNSSSEFACSRSVLFIGRVENSSCSVSVLNIINSQAITTALMSRSGGVFGRLYYSDVNATQITLNNINISSLSTTEDSYTTGITTSFGYSSLNLWQSSITSLNLSATSSASNVIAGSIHAQQNSAQFQCTDIIVDNINIQLLALNATRVAYAGMITASLSTAIVQSFNLTHVTIGTVNITFSSSSQYIGLISGYNDLKTILSIVDSKSIGTFLLQGTQYANCEQLTYQTNESGKQYINTRGC
ncbi:Hypothetical_protein [Hexamita inflata]|uniref:Hypothetical_protein n=1 Tax=Hexamita inflata TaxID=28002 RepID=A0AA86R4V8_9EUKA|nr:Hypothetical protein HINF_LOCUS57042 [Hexamita inflata]